MSRGLVTANSNAVTGQTLSPILFAELDFSGGMVYVHSAIGTITWGGNDWGGVGTLGAIEGLDEKSDLTRKTVTFRLTGIPNTLLSVLLAESYQGRAAKVYLGFFSNTTYQLVADPHLLFTGKMDSVTTEEGETFSIELTAENLLAQWARPVVRRYTDVEQQSKFLGDKGLEFLTQASQKEIVWGRKT